VTSDVADDHQEGLAERVNSAQISAALMDRLGLAGDDDAWRRDDPTGGQPGSLDLPGNCGAW
jgi:hypothetical protein